MEYKEVDYSEIVEVDEVDSEYVDFVYDNAVKFLDSTIDGIKSANNKAVLLLSYLMTFLGFVSIKFFSLMYELITECNSSIYLYIAVAFLAIFIVYYSWVAQLVLRITDFSITNIPQTRPLNLLNKSRFQRYDPFVCDDDKLRKYIIVLDLEDRIEENVQIMNNRAEKLRKAVKLALIFPALLKR